MKSIQLGEIEFCNDKPFVLIGGMNVLESRDLAMRIAEALKRETAERAIPFVFKSSFDKANRSSGASFRGPGLDEGLKILDEIRRTFDVPVLTDIHQIEQAEPAAEVCDILQLPAFLARQTDLVEALARTGKVLNIKKPQFMSPHQITNVVDKARSFANDRVILCERGSCFGYDNLVVDMLGINVMKRVTDNAPVVFDVTHSLQTRQPDATSSGGRRRDVLALAKAGLAMGLAGLFVEAHPDPDAALCDGPSALRLSKLSPFLDQVKAIDMLVKALPVVEFD